MKKFHTVLENALKDTGLRKVKLKVDPLFCSKEQITKYEGYEGYVLAEDKGTVQFYVECGCEEDGMVISVPSAMVNLAQSLSPLEQLKLHALEFFKQNKGLEKEDTLAAIIASAPTHESLEAFLYNNGCAESELLDIYRSFFVKTLTS